MFDAFKNITGTNYLLEKILFAGRVFLCTGEKVQVNGHLLNSPSDDGFISKISTKLVFTLLLLFSLLMASSSASAASSCSDFGGVIDGDVLGIPPSGQVQIDVNCTIRNWPASNPLTSNFSFFQPGNPKPKFLVVFDNVVHTGQMSCNSTHEHKIWFTNGSSTAVQDGCQNLLIPVEKIDKQSPSAYCIYRCSFYLHADDPRFV